MNQKTKKIIAREFLILLVLIIVTSLIFVGIIPYNLYQENRIEKINNSLIEKEELNDSLNRSVSDKIKNQEWFFGKVSMEFDITNTEYGELKTLWPLLQGMAENDSIEYRWNRWEKDLIAFHKSIGFTNAKELESFIEKNSISFIDSIQLKKSDSMRMEITDLISQRNQSKSKVLNKNDKIDFVSRMGIILFGILFILRYIIYAAKWSLKTLIEK